MQPDLFKPMPDLERRTASLELRAKGRRLEGLAIAYGVETSIEGKFVESVEPRACRGALASGKDILALVDHDACKVLGRTRSGSLRLNETAAGLEFSLDLPSTSYANDILALVERGDAGGCSFGFLVPKGGDEWRGQKRTLKAIDLREITICSSHAAYPSTIVHARSATGRGPSRVIFAERFLSTIERTKP